MEAVDSSSCSRSRVFTVQYQPIQSPLFCDFLRPGVDHIYEECTNREKLPTLLDSYLEDYNMRYSGA